VGVKNNLVVTDYYWFTRFSGLFGINSALPEVPIRIKKRNHKDQGVTPQTTPWNLFKKVTDLNGWCIVIIA